MFCATWASPAAPPKKITAPTRLAPRKASATGTDRNISTSAPPTSSAIAQYHSIGVPQMPSSRAVVPARAISPARQVAARRRAHSRATNRNPVGIAASGSHSGRVNDL